MTLKAKYRGAGKGGKRPSTVRQLRASARKRMIRGLPLNLEQKKAVAHYASNYVPGEVSYCSLKKPEPTKITPRQTTSWW